METSELTGCALDWAVAKCEGITYVENDVRFQGAYARKYSTDWTHGGPIIEREGIELFRNKERDRWYGTQYGGPKSYGPTPLVAAMRCFVASRLGDEVELPEELK